MDETSQEFQLIGNNDRLNWIVGAYYFAEDQTSKAQNWQRIELTGMGAGGPRLRNTLSNVATTDTALYGEITYDFTDRLTLTLGGRYSGGRSYRHDLRPRRGDRSLAFAVIQSGSDVRLIGGVPVIRDATFSAFTPRVAPGQYQWDDDVMVYGAFLKDSMAAASTRLSIRTLPNNGILAFTEEILTNYEFRAARRSGQSSVERDGLLGRLGTIIQIGETLTPGQMTNTNGRARAESRARSRGNVASDGQLLRGLSRLDCSTRSTRNSARPQPSRLELPSRFRRKSRRASGSNDNDLNNGGSVDGPSGLRLDQRFETFQEFDFQVALGPNKPYGLLSGRVTYTPPDSNWDVSFFGTNLTNEWYRLGGFAAVLAGIDQGVVARPREIGVAVNLEF